MDINSSANFKMLPMGEQFGAALTILLLVSSAYRILKFVLMKTDYNKEIKELLQSKFTKGTPKDPDATAMSLYAIWEYLTGVLPSKWIDESDVYKCLKELGYKTFIHEFEEKDLLDDKKTNTIHHLRYFVKMDVLF